MIDAVTLALFGDGEGWMTDLLLPAGLLLITVALLARLRKRRRRAAVAGSGEGGGITARERLERYRQEKGVRHDLESLMVEIEQLAKRMGSQLDAKTVQLEALIRQADDRLDQLRRASDGGPVTGSATAEPPAAPAGPSDADPLARSVCELAEQGLSPIDIARRLDEHVGKVELILALSKAGEDKAGNRESRKAEN